MKLMLHLDYIIPFIPVLKVTTFMAFVHDPRRLPFMHYTVVVPYVFSFWSGSHISWLPRVAVSLRVYNRIGSSSRLTVVIWEHDCLNGSRQTVTAALIIKFGFQVVTKVPSDSCRFL